MEMLDMTDAEQRIKELEAEVAALKLELAAVTGENVGLRVGLEAVKMLFGMPLAAPAMQPAVQPYPAPIPLYPVPLYPAPVNPPWNPGIWYTTTCVEPLQSDSGWLSNS
jgi:hypothetical protein